MADDIFRQEYWKHFRQKPLHELVILKKILNKVIEEKEAKTNV